MTSTLQRHSLQCKQMWCKYIAWSPLKVGKAGDMWRVKAQQYHGRMDPASLPWGPFILGRQSRVEPCSTERVFFVSRLCYCQPLVLSRPLRPIFWDEPLASGGKALTRGSGHGHGVLALWPPHRGAWPVHLTSPGFRSLGWTIGTLIRGSLWSFPAEQ